MNSRDVMAKNVTGVEWVKKSHIHGGWVMVAETWGSLSVDMRPYSCFIFNSLRKLHQFADKRHKSFCRKSTQIFIVSN